MDVLVAASSPVARAGLRATVEEIPGCTVVGVADAHEIIESAFLHPGIVLWQLAGDEDPVATLHGMREVAVVLLTDQAAMDFVRAGARGVLPWNASQDQISAALSAVALDLVVTGRPMLEPGGAERVSRSLTARETEVLQMISEGLANKEIAYRLGISEHTVKFHVSALLGKLGAGTRAEAIRIGIRQGVILL